MTEIIDFPHPKDISSQHLTVLLTSEQIKACVIALAAFDSFLKKPELRAHIDSELNHASHSFVFHMPEINDAFLDPVLGLAIEQLFNVYYEKREAYYERNKRLDRYRHPYFDLEHDAVIKMREE